MMTKIRVQLYTYITLDILLMLYSSYKGINFFINSQVAFLSALAIVVLSFVSYLRNINKQISALSEKLDTTGDILDEIDDPYNLYEDDEKDEQKTSQKVKLTMKNLSQSKGAALSLFRILGYALLVAGFFMLVKYKIFSILPYILGISIIPLGTLISAFLTNHR